VVLDLSHPAAATCCRQPSTPTGAWFPAGKDDIPQLVQQIKQIEFDQLLRMYKSLRRYRRAFLWTEGGRAFDYMVASLLERLHRMWGLIY
jgi:hypothetical protein